MTKFQFRISMTKFPPERWVLGFRIRKNDEGIITVASVQHTLNKNHSNLDANEVLEQAEVQGMLVRLAEGRWMLLE